MSISDRYALALEAQDHRRNRDPYNGGHGKAFAIDNPAGFRAYMTMARYSPRHTVHKITDGYGRERWLNDNGWRIYCAALLHIQSGTQTSLSAMAEKIGCCRMTASRWITKLTAWGLFGSSILRGKWGGLVLFGHYERFAAIARAKIAAIRARKLNAHPPTTEGREATYSLPPYLVSKGVHLDFRARDEALADALHLDRSRRSGSIKCPAHDDGRASLSWKWNSGERLLLHCFAGCTFGEIKAAV